MVFTEVAKDSIKTSEYTRDLHRFFSGEFDEQPTIGNKYTEKQRLRENLIQIIMQKYPFEYGKETNFAQYSDHELNSIAEYGDHRAEVDLEFVDIDYSPAYYEDPRGVSVNSYDHLDLALKDWLQEKVALQLGGYTMRHSLRTTKPKVEDSGHMGRMKDYKRILKGLPIKYRRATQFLLNEKLDEVSKVSMKYYAKRAKVYLAAIVLQLMRSYRDETVASVGIKEICEDFCIKTNGITQYFQEAISQYEFLQSKNKTMHINSIVQKKQKIKSTAQNYIYQFSQDGFVNNPSVINEFIEEIDNHYSNIFKMKNKMEKVFAILAAKLFTPQLRVSELACSLYDNGFTEEDEINIDLLSKQVKSWMKINDYQIKNDIDTGRIRNLYVREHVEKCEPRIFEVAESELQTDGSTVQRVSGLVHPSRPPFEFTYNAYSDRVIHNNNQKLLTYLSTNNLLDTTSFSRGSTKRSKKKWRCDFGKYQSKSLAVESANYHSDNWEFDQDVNPLSNFMSNDSNERYISRFEVTERSRNTGFQNFQPSDHKSSFPAIDQKSNCTEVSKKINYCYLGYPGAITRLLALISTQHVENNADNSFENSPFGISRLSHPEEGQNPSITWLIDHQKFFYQADQVMMNRNGLFGKWKQYVDKYDVQFLDDTNLKIGSLQDLLNISKYLLRTGTMDGRLLHPGSVIIFPDLRRLLLQEVESSVLRMAPNDFVRMKHDQYDMKIEDLEHAKDEKIRVYHASLNKESKEGKYRDMHKHEVQKMVDDFTDAQNMQFSNTRIKLRLALKFDIDVFMDSKHRLTIFDYGTDEYHTVHQSMYKHGVIMSDRVKYFHIQIKELIEQIRESHAITIYLGGILSPNIKTSQLLQEKTLNIKGILNNSVDQIVDQHLIRLCYQNQESSDNTLQLASVVSTNIPDKLSISSYKLPTAENERHGLYGKWCIEHSYNLSNLVEWVN